MNKEFNLNIGISTKNVTIPDSQEYVDIEGFASKESMQGQKVIDLADEHVETNGFDLIAKRLLLNHNHNEPVGDLELKHHPEGVSLKARVYKKAMEPKEFERVKLGLYDFSIGFFATDAEYKEMQGKNILCFTKGTIYETSLVAIPCNTASTVTSIKSLQNKMADGELPTKRELEKVLRDECGFSKRQANRIANSYDPIDDMSEVAEMMKQFVES